VTGHDFGGALPWRMPEAAWIATQDAADRHTADGAFVAVAGFEWTSQPECWTEEERLFDGAPRFFIHKCVYFPRKIGKRLFSAKDAATSTPDLLAAAVRANGGLVHNFHPSDGADASEQFLCDRANESVIANTEMWPDTLLHRGREHDVHGESNVRRFLSTGRRTGFVGGSDSHEGRPVARTAVLARELTRAGVFETLSRRRNYAITNARIRIDFRIDGRFMGEAIETRGRPRILVEIEGTDEIREAVVVRDGAVAFTLVADGRRARLETHDDACGDESYYYVWVVQNDSDEHGNPSMAWLSPIWVTQERSKE